MERTMCNNLTMWRYFRQLKFFLYRNSKIGNSTFSGFCWNTVFFLILELYIGVTWLRAILLAVDTSGDGWNWWRRKSAVFLRSRGVSCRKVWIHARHWIFRAFASQLASDIFGTLKMRLWKCIVYYSMRDPYG